MSVMFFLVIALFLVRQYKELRSIFFVLNKSHK